MKRQNTRSALQTEILGMLEDSFIIYHPHLFRLTQSTSATLLLCYLMYWQGKGAKGDWVYKTIPELEHDTGLTRSNQATAIKVLKDLGVLAVERKQIPARRHFKINKQALDYHIKRLQTEGVIPIRKSAPPYVGTLQTTTETTNTQTTSTDYTKAPVIHKENLSKLEPYKKQILNHFSIDY